MENHRSTSTIDQPGRRSFVPWNTLETRTDTAFLLAGASLLASLFVPVGLASVTERSWLAGIALVGLAVVATAVGLLGLYPRANAHSAGLARLGVLSALVAGAASVTVLASSAATAGAVVLPGVELSVGKRAFAILALTMAGGYALGFLSFGMADLRSDDPLGRTGRFLTIGGLLLSVPVVVGLAQLGVGIRLPAWVLFPVLGLVAVDTMAVGFALRSAS